MKRENYVRARVVVANIEWNERELDKVRTAGGYLGPSQLILDEGLEGYDRIEIPEEAFAEIRDVLENYFIEEIATLEAELEEL